MKLHDINTEQASNTILALSVCIEGRRQYIFMFTVSVRIVSPEN